MSEEQTIFDYKILDKFKIKYKDENNSIKDTILNDNKHNEIYDKLRILILISFYQKVRYKLREKINYVLEKTFLDKFYYEEINYLLLDAMNNISIKDIESNEPIDIILDESNFNKLGEIGKAISSQTEKKYCEEIILNKKKVNIYKELVFVNEEQLELFKCIFDIDIDKVQYVNNILKIAPNTILVGNLEGGYEYNTYYILEFKDGKTLKEQELLFKKNINNYIEQYIPFKDYGNFCFIGRYNDIHGIACNYDKNIKEYFAPFISSHFGSCPNLGLRNIGATCYMNSTLQCFCHIDKFVDYFKYNSKWNTIKENKEKYPLSLSFKELIENLWPDEIDPSKKDYPPNDFKETIAKMNPLFKGIAACDAKDLVNFIVMTLHIELCDDENNELEQITQIKNNAGNISPKDQFMKDFNKNNNTIISKLFYGVNFNVSMCTNCPYPQELYNYQTYFFMIFPLEEVRKYKQSEQPTQNNLMNANFNMNNSQPIMMSQTLYNNNQLNYSLNQMPLSMSVGPNNMNMMGMNNYMNNQYMIPQQGVYPNNFNQYPMNMGMPNQFNNMMPYQNPNNNYIMSGQQPLPQQQQPQQNQNNINKNEVNIEDCFEYSIKENIMSGDNSMYCQKCRSNQTFKMATKIETFPEILIIILNRGVGLEFDVKINFDKMINLGKYIEKEKKDENKEIEIIQYDLIGVISHLGESSDAGHFIAYCRDPIKRENWYKYNDAFVSKVEDFQKEVVDFGMPYVLFYQKH